MKALLKKDALVLLKQMKIFLLLILVFAFLPMGTFNITFVMVYASMLPLTAISFDESSKWDTMAAMMPVRSVHLVAGKYILGYVVILSAAALVFLGYTIRAHFIDTNIMRGETVYQIFFAVCIATTMMAIILPLIFKLGIEKGRLVFFALFALGFILSFIFSGNFMRSLSQILDGYNDSLGVFVGLGLTLCILVNMVSLFLSNIFYRQKQF